MPTEQGFTGLLASPLGQGLLAAGLGAMASRGTTMQALGRGGLLGLSAFGQAHGAERNRLMEMAQEQMRQDVLSKVDAGQTPTAQELSQAGFGSKEWADVMRAGRPDLATVDMGGQIGMRAPWSTEFAGVVDKTPTFSEQMTNANNQFTIGADGRPQFNAAQYQANQMGANADLARDIQRAAGTTAINAASDIIEVPDGQGGSVRMSRAQALAVLGGAPMAGQAPMTGQPMPAQGPRGGLGYTPPPDTSKEEYEFDKKLNADFGRAQGNVNLTDRATVYIDRLLANKEGLDGIMGPRMQYRPDAVMSEAQINANADLDSIKAKVVLDVMEAMKAQSATGATGFGNMNKEQLKVIEDAMGSLARAQTADQVRDNLRIIRNEMQKSRNMAVQDYEAAVKKYGSRFDGRYQPEALGALSETTTPQGVLQSRPSLDVIFSP